MKALKFGDTIGVISPSSPAAGIFQYRFERGIKQLHDLGFKVEIGKSALQITGYSAGTEKDRAIDLQEMFLNKDISAIICAIGGEHSCELLEHLNFEAIKDNPKILVGYSDITVLLLSIWTKTKMPTFYGPTLMTEFSEFGGILPFTKEWFCKALMSDKPIGKLSSSKLIIDEFISWGTLDDQQRKRRIIKTEEFHFIKDGKGEGLLICACIEALSHLKGTPYMPDFTNSILFIETASDRPNLPYLAAQLSDLINMKVFEKIKGLVFGKKNWRDDDINDLKKLLLQKTREFSFPIVIAVDFGHISPILTLPIGCKLSLSSWDNSINFIESPFD